jgi:hypothetical protein
MLLLTLLKRKFWRLASRDYNEGTRRESGFDDRL